MSTYVYCMSTAGKQGADRFFPVTASCVLPECGGYSECPQLDKCVYGWATVFMEPGHAVAAPGDAGAAAQAKQTDSSDMSCFPPG